MTQNTEQNVRTVREQDGQIQEMHADMVKAVCGHRSDYPEDVFRAYLKRHIVQAEARGPEEQRRKDGGQTTIVFQRYIPGHGWDDIDERRVAVFKRRGFETRNLYTRTANVPALEARIAELVEAEQLARADAEASKARVAVLEVDAARFAWVAENTGCFWYGLPGFGPVSGRSYADRMKDLRSAIDKNIARAALTREGGV
ncbi:MAG: hypothetical protein ABF812_09880 [Gluconobacter cerinus]|uniref:hypothetical protein n=1 Tax=Gluconobacter cerinus TaxID=38307 RepID=UPI0039ECF736